MLTIRNLQKRFDALPVLEGLDLDVREGEVVAVVGPSGCGKTTLLNIIAGFVRADGGTVDVAGGRVGYVFQEDRLLPWRTVAENIGLVRERFDRVEVERLTRLIGLDGFESYYPAALSGGMRQRCSIARAYHFRPDLLLMDEPFKSLDHNLRFEMLDVLMNVGRERRSSILFITHVLDEALAVASRIAVMGERPGGIVRYFSLGETDSRRDADSPKLAAVKRELIELIG